VACLREWMPDKERHINCVRGLLANATLAVQNRNGVDYKRNAGVWRWVNVPVSEHFSIELNEYAVTAISTVTVRLTVLYDGKIRYISYLFYWISSEHFGITWSQFDFRTSIEDITTLPTSRFKGSNISLTAGLEAFLQPGFIFGRYVFGLSDIDARSSHVRQCNTRSLTGTGFEIRLLERKQQTFKATTVTAACTCWYRWWCIYENGNKCQP